MPNTTSLEKAEEIRASLEMLAERCGDPTSLVYRRLFTLHPKMQAHFWRDATGAIKGEMLARTFEAILDFIGERRYAQMMISNEMVTHEGYDIPREIFVTFFGVIRDTVREALGRDWTPACEAAWSAMLAEIAAYAEATPRSDSHNPLHAAQVAKFEAPFAV